MKRLLSWNVNGIRAAEAKGLFDWMNDYKPDVLCLQETKAQVWQLSEKFLAPQGYTSYFHCAMKKGYSGVALYSREKALDIDYLGIREFDDEGRCQIARYPDFVLFNCYFPNSQAEGKRLDYKLRFNNAILDKANEVVKAGKNVVICGDFNVAHKPIDLSHPKANEKNPGYLPEERSWMDCFIAGGYVDSFRQFHKEAGQYSWWSYRMKARDRNVGWRLDYHCVNQGFLPQVQDSLIHQQVMGSDHCPVELVLK